MTTKERRISMEALEYLKKRNEMIRANAIDGYEIRRMEIDCPEAAAKFVEAYKDGIREKKGSVTHDKLRRTVIDQ
jgi:hypothetical protein